MRSKEERLIKRHQCDSREVSSTTDEEDVHGLIDHRTQRSTRSHILFYLEEIQ